MTFAQWEAGLMVKRGNPKQIQEVADLDRKKIAIMNPEVGYEHRGYLAPPDHSGNPTLLARAER